jgi:PhnB protein
MKAHIYLNFPGTTEEAFTFYKAIFGGEFVGGIHRFGSVPGMEIPAELADKVMHISLPLGDNLILMGTDAIESMGKTCVMGNNFSISIHPDSAEETRRLFAALAEGGKVEVELQEMFWAELFGALTDKYGVQWMFNYEGSKRA